MLAPLVGLCACVVLDNRVDVDNTKQSLDIDFKTFNMLLNAKQIGFQELNCFASSNHSSGTIVGRFPTG